MKSKQVYILALTALLTHNSQRSTCFAQGSLTPPGAPAPTMKTLSQIEPRTPISSLPYLISSSGAYYVTANLTGVSGSGGITINANEVTLDLCGFTLTGVSGSLNGISAVNYGQNYVIRNGTLVSWGVDGVNAYGGINCRFERLLLFGNAQVGLQAGTGSVVADCVATSNTLGGFTLQAGQMSHCVAGNNGTGIETAGPSVVADCNAFGNSSNGINCASGSVVRSCASYLNGSNGVLAGIDCKIVDCVANSNGVGGIVNVDNGINAGNNSTVNDCTASGNYGSGIFVANNCAVIACTASGNYDAGVSGGNNCSVNACNASGNGDGGISCGDCCTVIACTASGSPFPGIGVEDDCTVIACTVISNFEGLAVGNNCTIKDSTVNANGDFGILVDGNSSQIVGNTCSGNGNGIYITGSVNRVDGNVACTNTAYGIWPVSLNVDNCITRNYAPNNGLGGYNNFTGNNDYAPIGKPNTSSNPWQNFQ